MGTKIPANKYLIENFNQIIELEIYAISSQLYFLTRFELLVEFFFKKKFKIEREKRRDLTNSAIKTKARSVQKIA